MDCVDATDGEASQKLCWDELSGGTAEPVITDGAIKPSTGDEVVDLFRESGTSSLARTVGLSTVQCGSAVVTAGRRDVIYGEMVSRGRISLFGVALRAGVTALIFF